MLGIPRRHGHYVYGTIQSGLTSCVAAAIASAPFFADGSFATHWLRAWLLAWAIVMPVVLFAAPIIQWLTHALTREDA